MSNQKKVRPSYPALRVKQWLADWDEVPFENDSPRRKPEPHFYVLSLPAKVLRSLSGVERRQTTNRLEGGQDLNIQRKLDKERVDEIANFVTSGFPWSELPEAKRKDSQYSDLRMPGWLPTAIVINVKQLIDERSSGKVAPKDLITFNETESGQFLMQMPEDYDDKWLPTESLPIEVIDGQHRLFAFDSSSAKSFELPVVAFYGLDISWQAYLFYVINIKPKRINPSLAYDLYPLLRNEEWLNRIEGHLVYRDTRSQELTQTLWSFNKSPWHRRINMLGATGSDAEGNVNQASWVRSLTTAMVKRADGRGLGGLFGGDKAGSVPWTRTEQSAFLIYAWTALRDAIHRTQTGWVVHLRQSDGELFDYNDLSLPDPAFEGKNSLLNTDQGVRGFLHILNDMLMIRRSYLKLDRFSSNTPIGEPTDPDIEIAIQAFAGNQLIHEYTSTIANCLASFDWRASEAPGLNPEERTIRKTFRGSGGYKELRIRLLDHLQDCTPEVSAAAALVAAKLGYNESN